MNNAAEELTATIDCTREYGPDKYFGHGNVQVVNTPIGRYREAEGKPLSRFGYRFEIKNVGKPHLMVIRYPDDKRRFMCIVDGTSYDLSTGITSGFAYPVSGEMKEVREIFWPRWNDCTITFMTWGFNEPAAVASIDVYELEGLPAAKESIVSAGPGRELGIQYEDPCGTGASEGALDKETWVERVISYAKHTGQKLLIYPVAWYHGPQYPSTCEPADAFDVVVAPDRKQYIRWTSRPPDWISPMLKRFEDEELEFIGALTLMRLGSLMRQMNIDLSSIQAGTDTINNMLWNDNVQAGTMDWTTVYNVINYPKMLGDGRNCVDAKQGTSWAYGEKRSADVAEPYHPGPIFNPLHPVVQKAVRALVREIADKYGVFKSFKGVSINLWAPTIVWFGSIHSGYDDYCAGLFEQETGIHIPVDLKDPCRFSKRYEFISFHCRPAWISWRCRKIHQLICQLRDELVAARPDLKLILTLWSETTIPQLIGNGEAHHQLHARLSTVELYREAGFDPALYVNEPNVESDFQFEGGGRDRTAGNNPDSKLEVFTMFRDHDYLDQKTLDAWRGLHHPGAFIFNAWHEAWGKHSWFICDKDDPNKDALAFMSGEPAEGIFRMNSEYPKDGFWFDSQLRITPAFPPGEHFLEPYAHAVAELDACRITRGGLFLDKAHSEEIRRFSQAYRALPREKFDTVGTSTDPVAVRTLVHGGKRFLYLVNREHYPVTVDISFDRKAGTMTDLATGDIKKISNDSWQIILTGYELRSFALSKDVSITGFSLTPPAEILSKIREEAESSLRAIENARIKGHYVAGMDIMESEIKRAVGTGRLSWLRHALSGYIVLKCKSFEN
ncbi:MAG: family 10 glycosylhydrolase [Victivallales bacterium]